MFKHLWRRIFLGSIILILFLSCAPAAYASGNLKTQSPSKEEILEMWNKVTSAENVYEEIPSVKAPYAAGKLTDEFLETGLTMTNYARFVANLPLVELDDTLNVDAQHGAVGNAAIDTMTHYPDQPADMDNAFYNRAAEAARTSNLASSYGGYDRRELLKLAVSGWLDDSDRYNNDRVGHRRWMLNPTLKYVGFGCAQSESGCNYMSVKVFDTSGYCQYDYIAWPAAGNFPTNLFDTDVPWSISLNPENYRFNFTNIEVTLTRQSDGKTFTFTNSTGAPGDPSEAFLTTDLSAYGSSHNCIIFNPGSKNIDRYEGVYTVDVTGIYNIDGEETSLHYEVDFFDVPSGCIVHQYSYTVTEPTCTNDGYTTYSCNFCGHSYVDYVPSNGEHRYASKVTKPTCTNDGYTTYTCRDCGECYVDNYVPAEGHIGVYFGYVAPTCTKTGLAEGKCCLVCDEILVEQEMIPALGHSWDNGVVTREPTKNKPGIRTYTCGNCGETKTEEIPYQGTTDNSVLRISGKDRVKTALSVATALKDTLGVRKFDAVVIATGVNEKFADALAGSYLANMKGAPILLYTNAGLSAQTVSFIEKNLNADGTVYILGGTGAIPETVEETLAAYNVKRLSGKTRYETNLAILNEVGVSAADEILVATGANFADSLSASATGLPLLLVNGKNTTLTTAQTEFLQGMVGKKITIIGGTGAVSAEIEAAIEAIVGVEAERISGKTRNNTSVMIAQKYFEDADFALITYSKNFPDGLAGGPLAYAMGAPLLLTNAGSESITNEYITAEGIERGYALGGDAAISDETARLVFGLDASTVIEKAYYTE